MRKTAFLALALAVSLGAGSGARADGMLDPSFGNGGLVTTAFFPFSYDFAGSVVMLPDGRAVAAGSAGDIKPPASMAAARYLPSGALDATFGGGGLVTLFPGGCEIAFGGPGNGAEAALLQPDGRLVLVGMCSNFDGGGGLVPVFWVVRLNVDGALDSSFGAGGQVYLPFAQPGTAPTTNGSVTGVLQPDGRIVVMGWGNMAVVVAARFNPDGSLDPTFGIGGQVALPLADDFVVESAALQPDGKLVIGGTYGSGAARDFGLLRLLPNGAPDPSFDRDGLVTSDFGAPETGYSVIVLGDGRVVLGGYRGTSPLIDFALVRYLPDGTLDTSFGNGGLATADAGGQDYAGPVIELPNGKLVLVGSTDAAGGHDFLLARFHADGALDNSFGTAGFVRTDFGSGSDYCSAVAIAGQDLILTAGTTWPRDTPDFALARYIASTPVELLAFEVE
jgi:uncharacterized delta-60 repeat protein